MPERDRELHPLRVSEGRFFFINYFVLYYMYNTLAKHDVACSNHHTRRLIAQFSKHLGVCTQRCTPWFC